LMDQVSDGNLNVVLTPLQPSDRLSGSFQKLLAKVSESINAKRDLEKALAAIRQITEQIVPVGNGNFEIAVKSDFAPAREIADTLNFLIHRLSELAERVKSESIQTRTSAKEVQKTISSVIGANESRLREMRSASQTLNQLPQTVRNISEELFASSQTARQSIERARNGSQTAQENLSAVNVLRGQLRETVKQVGLMGERTLEIGKAARTMEDLTQRTNMIALNASLKTFEAVGDRRGLTVFTDEIERLAERTAGAAKQFTTLDKTLTAEICEIENSLKETVGEAANLSRFAVETGNSLDELERSIGQFLNLQEKLVVHSGGQTADAETAFECFAASITETETAVKHLKESETQTAQMAAAMENLQFAIAEYKVSSNAAAQAPPVNDYSPTTEANARL